MLTDDSAGRAYASLTAGSGCWRSHTHAVEGYLNDEVLAGRPSRQRRFLLETSIVEHLCAGLANAITTESDGQRMLEEMERDSGFVVRMGPAPRWFRYHHLLRDMLGHRLNLETPADLPDLHRRAARWYADNNLLMEALTHAVRARDWTYASRLVTTRVAPLILSTQRAAFVKILQRVPREQLASTPELMMCDVLQIFEAGNYDAIPARVARIRGLMRDKPDASRDPTEVLLLTLQAADRVVGDTPALVTKSYKSNERLEAGKYSAFKSLREKAEKAWSSWANRIAVIDGHREQLPVQVDGARDDRRCGRAAVHAVPAAGGNDCVSGT